MEREKTALDGIDEPGDELWRRRYETFARLYRGRPDVIAEQRDGRYFPVEGSGLTYERFLEHVRMEKTYAIYNKDDQGMVGFGLFDVDVLPRDQDWGALISAMPAKKRETSIIMQTLMDMGLQRNNMLLEFPTVGYHLLIFFDRPVPAIALNKFMKFVLDRCGLAHMPFYPRKVEEAPRGDRVQLPLRINLNTSRRSAFIRELESFNPEKYDDEPDFSILEEVAPIESGRLALMLDKHLALKL